MGLKRPNRSGHHVRMCSGRGGSTPINQELQIFVKRGTIIWGDGERKRKPQREGGRRRGQMKKKDRGKVNHIRKL